MKGQARTESNHAHGWAERTVTQIHAPSVHAFVDDTLTSAVYGTQNLRAETNMRRANALRAAAMGLGSAGCAAAAGITESLLANWRAHDPAFNEAMEAVSTMAATNRVAPNGQINGYGLRFLLQALARGASLGRAAATVNLRRGQLTKLRQENAAIDELIKAAVLQGRNRQRDPRRHKHAYSYRLVNRAPDNRPITSPKEDGR
ncbi:hypothetical protein [Streptomyces sp. NPDC059979]|uniref:hypothetical protein n=1 Tax=Streptomyces sp. NPDC059979 TaxID=3347021 RepID=UPI0036829AFB